MPLTLAVHGFLKLPTGILLSRCSLTERLFWSANCGVHLVCFSERSAGTRWWHLSRLFIYFYGFLKNTLSVFFFYFSPDIHIYNRNYYCDCCYSWTTRKVPVNTMKSIDFEVKLKKCTSIASDWGLSLQRRVFFVCLKQACFYARGRDALINVGSFILQKFPLPHGFLHWVRETK